MTRQVSLRLLTLCAVLGTAPNALHAIHDGHVDVQQQNAEIFLFQNLHHLFAILDGRNVVVLKLKNFAGQILNNGTIFGNQDAFGN